ncbi:acyl-CoA reductase [Daejeonella sp. H1SJ63]|uniref:acyl-CoA reductase n=1 Tax=Daejeonella sp. H1SJ63 TaxID=3034145 RepID=UPI0023ECCB78|nr:acyl-CoA reductase [Daejeonella sp. H1SJ63]
MSKNLTSKQRIGALAQLGDILRNPDTELTMLINSSKHYNPWFTPENTAKAVASIAEMLNEKDLHSWIGIEDSSQKPFSIGLVLAGNIPLVGFHDILSVLGSGNRALIKLSSQDKKLTPYILNKLVEIGPGFDELISYVEKLTDYDAVIATGSNNTSRYFEYYFSKVPHIIRKNRNSIAVLTGNESTQDLKALGTDIFDYFGLGCRNVSKIYVPRGYNFNRFFESIEEFKCVNDHHKYNNNYDYNKSIFLVNMDKHLDNGFLLLKEDKRLTSPLAVIYFEEYENIQDLEKELEAIEDQIQCIISNAELNTKTYGFGKSQLPGLWDYADGIDTMKFLQKL